MHLTLPALLAVGALTAIGCGGDGDAPKIRTTDAGTVIVGTTAAGLKVEIQDDNLYVQLTDDAPEAARKLAGEVLGGACEVDGGGRVKVGRQFPIYWRDDPGDWGTAVIRDPIGGTDGDELLAQHVTSCRIFATKPAGVTGQRSFNEATDKPYVTVKLR